MRLLFFIFATILIALFVGPSGYQVEANALPPNKRVESDKKLPQTNDNENGIGAIEDLNAEPVTSTTTTQPTPVQAITSSQSRIVPLSEWHCGSGDWDKWFAHSLIEDDCPTKMVETNQCCILHDDCYVQQASQEECDRVFCECLDQVLAERKCQHISRTYCSAVQAFGADAHKNAKVVKTSATEQPKTTKIPETTTTTIKETAPHVDISILQAVDKTEKKLFQKAVNETMRKECFAEDHAMCKTDLEECHDKGFTCIYNFCECAHHHLIDELVESLECRENLHQLCGNYFDNEGNHHGKVEESWVDEKLGLSLPLAVFIFVCLLISIGSATFWLTRYLRQQRHLRKSSSAKGLLNDANSSSSSSTNSESNFDSSSLIFPSPDHHHQNHSHHAFNCLLGV